MAEEVLKAKKQEVGSLRLVPSSGGVFEVTVAGKKIFSKKETGRHPEPGEILQSMETR